MFGTVRAYKPEMRFKDYETYKALYCTVCRTVGKKYGILMRLALNYDIVFMAALGMSAEDGTVCFEQRRCTVNPLKKCSYCKCRQPIIDYCSAVLVLLSEAKVRDGISDHRGIKKAFYRFIRLFFARPAKKAKSDYPEASKTVDTYISAQIKSEKDFDGSLDMISAPTAEALEALFGAMSDDRTTSRIFEKIGYCLGKWIYICDAVRDREDDEKRGCFNPFSGLTAEQTREKSEPIFNTCICILADDLALLDTNKFRPILENIIFYGLKHSIPTQTFSEGK